MKLKLFVFFIFSLITLSCHKSNVNEEKPIEKARFIQTALTDSVIKLNAKRQLEDIEEQKAAIKYDLKTYPNAKYKIFYVQSMRIHI